MFQSEQLDQHLKTSNIIKSNSIIISEWNMNDPDNIKMLGNYRYRPSWSSSEYFLLPSNFDELDAGNYFTGATDSDAVIDSGILTEDQPSLFITPKQKMKMLFSLEDCIKPFRPRSGINKVLYFGNIGSEKTNAQFIDDPRSDAARRPRYYMASRDDQFKYWTSFRTEYGQPSPINPSFSYIVNKQLSSNLATLTTQYNHYIRVGDSVEVSGVDDVFNGTFTVTAITSNTFSYEKTYIGSISSTPVSPMGYVNITRTEREIVRGFSFYHPVKQLNYIEDAVPFVVYENSVPTNRIVLKMQTNVGEVSLGNFRYDSTTNVGDPLYGDSNKTIPSRWRIEVLKGTSWIPVTEFDENSTKPDGTALIGADGYLEISYGLSLPKEYENIFIFAQELPNKTLLPDKAPNGYTYLIKENQNDIGTMWIYANDKWDSFVPQYNWHLSQEGLSNSSNLLTKISNPDYFITSDETVYREFEFIDGIRIVVQTMNKKNCTFDLIEFSPRLVANISDYVMNFSITKTMSDLGNSSIPVGGLFASTGTLNIFDPDFTFNYNNVFDPETKTGSLIANYLSNMVKFNIYEGILDVSEIDYYLPLKIMYSYGFPQVKSPASTLDLQLRDFFFFLETSKAPELFLTNVSISYAIMLLLDFIGFDNYVFKRIDNFPELIIPYFFVEQGQNVAEVLQKLAIASQTTMFFDEYNNFVVMSKEYLLPTEEQRETDTVLLGSQKGEFLPNIAAFASVEKKVYNAGQITYTTRYLQRSIGQTTTAAKIDEYKNYVYKPSLLWEAPGREAKQTINEIGGQSSGYTLGAVPLNSDLTKDLPYVNNNIIYNNIIDLGENVYWLVNYQGYLYANGEIIRFDAIEYAVSGQTSLVWITNNKQYQDYFSKLPFNGKMYPTGRVRIYTKPQFANINGITVMRDENPIKEHGRGQFGTKVTDHSAGLDNDTYWKNDTYVRGCIQEASDYLFNTSDYVNYPTTLTNSNAGKTKQIGSLYLNANAIAKGSARSGIIKNFMTDKYFTETELAKLKTTEPGSIQSSALVVTGPEVPAELLPNSFVSYIYKEFLDENGAYIPYKHFGTRMRVVGKIESGTNKSQTPTGGYPIYTGANSESSSVVAYTQPASTTNTPNQEPILNGGGGGIGINIDKEKNTGYYFEIAALTVDNISDYNNQGAASLETVQIVNSPAAKCVSNEVTVWTDKEFNFVVGQSVIISGLRDVANPTNTQTPLNGEYVITAVNSNKKQFKYKINASPSLTTTSSTAGQATRNIGSKGNISNVFFYKVVSDSQGRAIPKKLWSGLSMINVDSGEFYGQGRLFGEDNPTVYDLAVEYRDIGSIRRFYLYLNNKQIAVVDDKEKLDEKSCTALFVRGSSKCMFENIYALGNNYSQNTNFPVQNGVTRIFGDEEIDSTEALNKYALNGMIQKTYLSGVSSQQDPQYMLYFEEFGTIMREAAYFNIKYDRAFPALYAKLMKTTNNLKGYTASGFYAWSYGADFLIFNCTDFSINLDDTSGNYLKIMGITFTQSTTYTMTVDDLYKKRSNLLDTALGKSTTLYDPLIVDEEYNTIKNSRDKYGTNEITIDSPYIQSSDAAEDVFGWIISKISKPRKMIGLTVFGSSNIQLGDIVYIDYVGNEDIDIIVDPNKRFVIYQIEYTKNGVGMDTTMYLAEV